MILLDEKLNIMLKKVEMICYLSKRIEPNLQVIQLPHQGPYPGSGTLFLARSIIAGIAN